MSVVSHVALALCWATSVMWPQQPSNRHACSKNIEPCMLTSVSAVAFSGLPPAVPAIPNICGAILRPVPCSPFQRPKHMTPPSAPDTEAWYTNALPYPWPAIMASSLYPPSLGVPCVPWSIMSLRHILAVIQSHVANFLCSIGNCVLSVWGQDIFFYVFLVCSFYLARLKDMAKRRTLFKDERLSPKIQ